MLGLSSSMDNPPKKDMGDSNFRILSKIPGNHFPIKVEMATQLVNWNISKRHAPWRQLVTMEADVALLQEASTIVPTDVASTVRTGGREH